MRILILFSLVAVLQAQSVAVTAPAANQTISGISFMLTVAISNLESVHSVEYDINGEVACIATTPPYSCNWNTYYIFNNAANSIVAVARDTLNNVVATSPAVSPFTVDNPLPEHISQFNFTISPSIPVTSTWHGTVSTAPTFTGTNAPSGNYFVFWVDGKDVPAYNSIDTTQYDNGVHTIVWTLRDTVHPTTIMPSGGSWDEVGEQEYQINFQNGAAAMELRCQGCAEVFLCPSPAPNCLTTYTMVPIVYNTDGSTTAVSAAAFSSGNTAVVTVGASTGVLTPVATGSTQITITANGLTTKPWVFVNSQNVVPHFGADGSILTAYNPAKSMFVNSMFQSCSVAIASNGAVTSGVGGVLDTNYPPQVSFLSDYTQSGWNVCEAPLYNAPVAGVSQSLWQSGQTAYVANMTSLLASSPGIYFGLIGDGMTRQTTDLYASTRGLGSTFSPTSIQYTFNSWLGNRAILAVMQDEVNSTWGYNPLQGNAVIGSASGPTSIDCTVGPCNVSWTGYSIQSGTNKFLITGSGDPNLDYNPTTNLPALYPATNTGNNSFTFPRPAGVSSLYTASSNPGLTIQPLVAQTFQGTGVNYPGAAGCTSAGGGNAQPCIDWVHWDAFQFVRAQANNVAGRVAMTWAPRADVGTQTIAKWMGSSMSDFSNVYTTSGTIYYLANQYPLGDIQADYLTSPRSLYGAYNPNEPMLMNSDGSNVTWSIQGYTRGLTGCTGNICTTTSPHSLYNSLITDTRGTISGATSGNGQYYIISSPTANTLALYDSDGQFTANFGNMTGVTATFQDGSTYSISLLTASGPGHIGSPYRFGVTSGTDPGCTVFTKQNQTVSFATTGSSIGSFAGATFYVFPQNAGTCLSFHGLNMAQVPNLSSTGGSISIIPSNGFTRGISWPGPSGIEQGPRYNFATVTGCGLLRCAGQRAYILGQNWNGSGAVQVLLNTIFTSTSIQDIQGSMHPRFDYAGSVETWHAVSLPTLLITRLAKFYFQPNLPSPDYGRNINCGAHRGSYGNLLMCQSFSESPSSTRTIDLTSIAVSGQKTIKYCAGWQSITVTLLNASVTSDIQTFTPDGCSFVAYVGANNQAAEYSPPVISVRLTDVAAAADVVVQYDYLPYPFTNPFLQSMMLPQTFDCGTGSACVLPVDRRIGQIWYRIIYLGNSGQVLATSDLQTL